MNGEFIIAISIAAAILLAYFMYRRPKKKNSDEENLSTVQRLQLDNWFTDLEAKTNPDTEQHVKDLSTFLSTGEIPTGLADAASINEVFLTDLGIAFASKAKLEATKGRDYTRKFLNLMIPLNYVDYVKDIDGKYVYRKDIAYEIDTENLYEAMLKLDPTKHKYYAAGSWMSWDRVEGVPQYEYRTPLDMTELIRKLFEGITEADRLSMVEHIDNMMFLAIGGIEAYHLLAAALAPENGIIREIGETMTKSIDDAIASLTEPFNKEATIEKFKMIRDQYRFIKNLLDNLMVSAAKLASITDASPPVMSFEWIMLDMMDRAIDALEAAETTFDESDNTDFYAEDEDGVKYYNYDMAKDGVFSTQAAIAILNLMGQSQGETTSPTGLLRILYILFVSIEVLMYGRKNDKYELATMYGSSFAAESARYESIEGPE